MTVGLEAPESAGQADRSKPEAARPDPFTLETWGWSSSPEACEPKITALASLLNLAPPDPVARVSYQSRGNLLVVAGDDPQAARDAAEALAPDLHVTLLDAARPAVPRVAAWSGSIESIAGHLGEFNVVLRDLVTPEGPRKDGTPARFDLVLDFSARPLFAMRQPPQGYYRAPAEALALDAVLSELRSAVGEFEKPRFFAYRENLCAHSRSEITGCNACIEICSTQAISSDGNHVKVDPHLCMGCGACATVCPSGAMAYQYPRVADRGAQLKQLLSTYRHAGGEAPCILFHDGGSGRELLAAAAAAGEGLPARVLPLETWSVASIGLDLMLPAVAFGAVQVVVLAAPGEDRQYVEALRGQAALAQSIVSALGYEGTFFAVVEAADGAGLAVALQALRVPAAAFPAATFLLGNDKRTAIEFAVEHLVRHAPSPVEQVALPAGAPFGAVRIDKDKCTMCMSCVGACPSSALMDGVDKPLVKFLERNCVQCGLCESTCPEDAISLDPRLLLTPAVREARVLNETQPFHCVSCQKPFGTRQMVDAMMGRLANHSMFAGGAALRRLQMCADCRVVDMMKAKDEVSVLRLGADA